MLPPFYLSAATEYWEKSSGVVEWFDYWANENAQSGPAARTIYRRAKWSRIKVLNYGFCCSGFFALRCVAYALPSLAIHAADVLRKLAICSVPALFLFAVILGWVLNNEISYGIICSVHAQAHISGARALERVNTPREAWGHLKRLLFPNVPLLF